MPDKTFDILIEIRTKLQGLEEVAKHVSNARKEAEGFNNAFKIGGAVEIMRRVADIAAEVPQHLVEWVKQGIEFNALMERSRLGVAGVLRQFDGTNYRDFNSSLLDSDRIIGLLLAKSNKLGLSFEAMLEQYRTTAGALFAGGVRDLQKQVDLTVLLQQAMAAIGISGFQAQRDIFDILEGRASRTIAARALGITDADIARATEAGKLYEFLTTKLAAVAESGAQIGNTFGATEQRTKNLAEQLKGVGTTEFFKFLKIQLDDFNAALAKPETAENIRGWGNVFTSIVDGAKTGVTAVIDTIKAIDHFLVVPEKIFEIEQKLLGLPFAEMFDVGKAAQFVDTNIKLQNSIIAQVQGATQYRDQLEARRVLDDAILTLEKRVSNETGLTKTYAEQFLHNLLVIRDTFPDIAGSAEKVARSMQLSSEAADKIIKSTQGRQDFRRGTVDLIPTDDKEAQFRAELEAKRIELFRSLNPDSDPLKAKDVARDVQERLAAITLEHQKTVAAQKESLQLSEQQKQATIDRAGGNTAAADASERQVKIIREFNQLLSEGETDEARAWQLATDHVDAEQKLKTAKEGTRTVQREIRDLLRQESELLAGIRDKEKLVSQNPSLTANEKQTQLHALFGQELQTIGPEITRIQEALNGAYGPLTQEQVEQLTAKLRVLRTETTELGFKLQTSDFTGGIQAGLLSWVTSFGTAAQQVSNIITGTLNTAIAGAAQAITGLLFRTQNFGQAALQVFQSIIQQLIQMGLQMLITSALGSIIHRAKVAEQVQGNATIVTSATPAAVAQSGATSGSNWIVGAIAAGVAIAAIIALIAGGFESGGPTGGREGRFAGWVHGEEHVQPAPVVRKYGVDLFEAFRLGKIPIDRARALVSGMQIPIDARVGPFEDGGLAASIGNGASFFPSSDSLTSSASAGETKIELFHFTDPAKMAKAIMESDAGIIGVIDAVNGNFHKIRKRS